MGISETKIQQTGPQPNWKKLHSKGQSIFQTRCAPAKTVRIEQHGGGNLRSPKENTSDGDISKGRDSLTLDRRSGTTVNTNEIHDETLSNTGPQQTSASSKRIGDKCEERGAGNRLNDTVDTSGEETGVGSSHSQVLEDLRSVVVLREQTISTQFLMCLQEYRNQILR